MRIIAGCAKGRALGSVASATRPTSDRAREALFSTLTSEFTHFSGLNVLDLFAGTGAVGLEALSRGAALVHAVEKDSAAATVIQKNFEIVCSSKPEGEFHLYSMAVQKFLKENITTIKYHIVYLDPPYEFSSTEIEKILRDLVPHLDPIALIAIERDSKSRPLEWPEEYVLQREKEYGSARISYAGVAG